MPVYPYTCAACGWQDDKIVELLSRDYVACPRCEALMTRRLSAPLFRIAGRVTPGGGPDKFTADALGIPLKDLPSGLKTPEPRG